MTAKSLATLLAAAALTGALTLSTAATAEARSRPRPTPTWSYTPPAPAPSTTYSPFPGIAMLTPGVGATRVAINARSYVQFTAYPTNAGTTTITVTDPSGARVPLVVVQEAVYGATPPNLFIYAPANGSTYRANTTYRVTVSGVVLTDGTVVPTASWLFTTGTGWQY